MEIYIYSKFYIHFKCDINVNYHFTSGFEGFVVNDGFVIAFNSLICKTRGI